MRLSLFRSPMLMINDFSGLHISDGTMWYPMPSKHWPAYSTLTMYLLASVCLYSEILEKDTGASSKELL